MNAKSIINKIGAGKTKRDVCLELGIDPTEYCQLPHLSFRAKPVIVAEISESAELFEKFAKENGLQFSSEFGTRGEIFRDETKEEILARLEEDLKTVKNQKEEEKAAKLYESLLKFSYGGYSLVR